MFTPLSLRLSIPAILLCTPIVMSDAIQDTDKLEWSDSVVQTEEEGPGILIIPMYGQMHTDISSELYEGLAERIKEVDPDLIVIEPFKP